MSEEFMSEDDDHKEFQTALQRSLAGRIRRTW